MRNDPLEEGARWLRQAREDLKWARSLYGQGGGYHIICFLCQQIAEKGVKAFLYARGEEIVLGHSIARLSEKAGVIDAAFQGKSRHWLMLDGYYITARYPNGIPGGIPSDIFTAEMAARALEIADEVLAFVDERVGFSS